jgi:hypothetical protein
MTFNIDEDTTYRARVDLLYIHDGVAKLHEIKTKDKITTGYIKALQLQIQTQWLAALANIKHIEYAIISRPSIKQTKNETMEEYLARADERTTCAIYNIEPRAVKHQVHEEIRNISRAMKRLQNNTRLPRMSTNACTSFNSSCPYLPLCCKDPDADMLYQQKDELFKSNETF